MAKAEIEGAMIYEARHARGINLGLAAAVAALSILGFVASGVIPTESTRVGGAYPLAGWAIVAACAAAAAVFLRRAFDGTVQARLDERGVLSRRLGPDAVPWSEIAGFHVLAAGIQRIARFDRRSGKTFGINTSFYDRGIEDLTQAVRQYRPDLIP
jgi:hypothetical protein